MLTDPYWIKWNNAWEVKMEEERGPWKSDEKDLLVIEKERATAPCANHGCVRLSVDMCGNCNMHYCASHLWMCATCRRGPFCDVCVTPINHTCVPDPGAAATAGDAGGAGAAC